MKRNPIVLTWILLLGACGTMGGCGGGPDVWLVVQESNQPFTPCATAYEYTQDLPVPCDGHNLSVQICSEQALCPAQIDALIAPVAACQETRREFSATAPDNC